MDSEKLIKLQEIVKSMGTAEEQEYEVDALVVEEGNSLNAILSEMATLQKSHLLLEHETYKKFGNSPVITYRVDKGDGTPGRQTHVHVFLKGKQLYAINMDGTPHDGSQAKLSKSAIKFLETLGVTPPKDGLLEWIVPKDDDRKLLLD